MQVRHKDTYMYFSELAVTSEKYILPYIAGFHAIGKGTRVLEMGCGYGGNLVPFAACGCDTVGVDIGEKRISDAKSFFEKRNLKGDFFVNDVTELSGQTKGKFDIVICHDVVEHIEKKAELLHQIAESLADGGIAFIAFPAWYMPFGGHQQVCRNKFLSHCPWLHLLPAFAYKALLKLFRENESCIEDLLSIKQTRTSIEMFEKLVRENSGLSVVKRDLYFINPHYEIKFGLRPRKLYSVFSKIPYLRDFLSSSCFYILAHN